MSSTQQAPEATPEPPIARSRALGIVASSGAAAVCSFLITVVSTNSLGSEELALEFLVFWALLFGAYGVISGVQNETTRATSAVWLAAHAPPGAGRPVTRGAPVLAGAAVMGGAAAALVGASRPEQLKDSVQASGVVLDAEVKAAIDAALAPVAVTDPALTDEVSPKSRPA